MPRGRARPGDDGQRRALRRQHAGLLLRGRDRRAGAAAGIAARAAPGAAAGHRGRRGRGLRDQHGRSDAGPARRRCALCRHCRRGRRPGGPGRCRGLAAPCAGCRRHRLPAIHLGLHLGAQGRDGQPRQPHRQRGRHPAAHGHRRGRPLHVLGTAVPRHGPDRRPAAAAVQRAAAGADLAAPLPGKPRALAGADLAPPRHHQRRPRLRLPHVPGAHQAVAAGAAGPVELAAGLYRCRARACRHRHGLRAALCRLRAAARRGLCLLRPGRGHPVHHRRQLRRGRHDHVLRYRGPGPGPGRGKPRRRADHRAGGLRPRRSRPCGKHRRSAQPAGAGARPRGRDLGARPQHQPGLLGQAAANAAGLCRACRPALAAHGRPGLRARRAGPCGGPHQGPDHRARAQPLPAGHRARGRGRGRSRAQGTRGRVCGGHRWPGRHRHCCRSLVRHAKAGAGPGPGRCTEHRRGRAVRRGAPGDRAAQPRRLAPHLQRQAAARSLPPGLVRAHAGCLGRVRVGPLRGRRQPRTAGGGRGRSHHKHAGRPVARGARWRCAARAGRRGQLLRARRQLPGRRAAGRAHLPAMVPGVSGRAGLRAPAAARPGAGHRPAVPTAPAGHGAAAHCPAGRGPSRHAPAADAGPAAPMVSLEDGYAQHGLPRAGRPAHHRAAGCRRPACGRAGPGRKARFAAHGIQRPARWGGRAAPGPPGQAGAAVAGCRAGQARAARGARRPMAAGAVRPAL
ncbi:MAG: hypothetical protein GAK34_01152 [Delftia tsuruhatensis]|nr:MAG: hypothetical protein GAK34_01152 [Delftia tsuruhatensis]